MPRLHFPLPNGPPFSIRSFFLLRQFLDRYLTPEDRRDLVELSAWAGAGEYCGHVPPEGDLVQGEGLWYGVPLANAEHFGAIIERAQHRAARQQGD